MCLAYFDSSGSCVWELHMSRWENILVRGKFYREGHGRGRISLNREIQFSWLFSGHSLVHKIRLSSVLNCLCIQWDHSQVKECPTNMKKSRMYYIYWAVPRAEDQKYQQVVNSYCPNPFEGRNWACVKNSYLEDNFFLIRLRVCRDELIESVVQIALSEIICFMYIYALWHRGISAFCHGFFPDQHQGPDSQPAAANLCFSKALPYLRSTHDKCLSFKEESGTTRKQI